MLASCQAMDKYCAIVIESLGVFLVLSCEWKGVKRVSKIICVDVDANLDALE